MTYNSHFTECQQLVANMALLPLKTKFKGPAPIQSNDQEEDIIDEALYKFKALIFFKNFEIQSPADRVLVYLMLYILECLKRLIRCARKDAGLRDLQALGIEPHFDLPGDPNFPRELSALYAKPRDAQERELMKQYMQQLRQETGRRLGERVFPGGDADPPSKWWMCFAKKKFLDKSLTGPSR